MVAVPAPADIMSAPLGDAAVLWARSGWQVFPIVPRGKTPYHEGDFCGRDDEHSCGFHCATSDLDQITAWWGEHPDSNIGLSAPDAFVIDEDRVSALREAGLHLPVCPWQITGRADGGKHYFLTTPGKWAGHAPGARVRNRLDGVEVKGFNKGYVIAAPSVHATGRLYTLQKGGHIPECPAVVANALTEITLPDATPAGVITITAGSYVLPAWVSSGGRYEEIVRYTAHLYNRGLTRVEMWSLVEGQLAPRFDPPLPRNELRDRFDRATAQMAERLGEPRSLPTARGDESDELMLLSGRSATQFPESPDPAVYGGLLGELVDDIAEGTSAARVGLLGSLLAFCGALVPGRSHFHGPHTSSPFVALVGESGTGRKSTAINHVHGAMSDAVEPTYVNRVVLDGIASGEGLIRALADKQKNYQYEPTVGLVLEHEYASLLAVRQREGSSLDPKLRAAFDGTPLSNRKAGETVTVQPPYWVPALIAITPVELRLRLEAGALQTGSANRWLYLPVHGRDNRRNIPPAFNAENRKALVAARKAALEHQEPRGVAPAATDLLSEYDMWLPTIGHGLTRDLTRRMAAIAFRVALVHALVERSPTVTAEQTRRAIALTEYARSGIPWVFGQTVGSGDADLLLRHLVDRGRLSKRAITQEIIRDPLRRQAAIDELTRLNLADVVRVNGTGGRSRTDLVPVVSGAGFVRFVHLFPTEPNETIENTAPNAPKRTNDRTEVAPNQHESSTEAAHKQIETPPTTTWCQFFADHQFRHRDVSGNQPWCEICSPRGV